MRTWSLRRRVALFALTVVVMVLLVVDLLLTVSIREEFDREVQRAMDARVALAEELDDGGSPAQLVAMLTARGVPAVVVGDDGVRRETGGELGLPPEPHAVSVVELAAGTRVEVIVSRAGAETAQRRVLLIGTTGTGIAVAAVLVVLALFTERVLRPLDEVVETAREIARGRTGARLAATGGETELGRLAEAFDEMLDVQEAALATAHAEEARSRRFLADAAHQLRTPVAGLRAASEALLHDPDTADRDRLLAHLARESSRTGRLLDALLRVAEQDRGDAPARKRIDVVAIVADEVDRQRPLAPRLTIDLMASGSCWLTTDGDGLREAVANLLDNARRHARTRIEVAVHDHDAVAVVRVADDGPGLRRGTEEQVFERFVSLDDRGGAGLGLPIARATARAQGGDLRWIDGAFELTVPRATPPAVEADPQPLTDPAVNPRTK
jgi:two-component system, OmpR family, sensor kinase